MAPPSNFAIETFVDGCRPGRQTAPGPEGDARVKVFMRMPEGGMTHVANVRCRAHDDALEVVMEAVDEGGVFRPTQVLSAPRGSQ